MDPVNGDVGIEGVNHADDSRSRDMDDLDQAAAQSASYWEEVNQEEIERERRYCKMSVKCT